MNRNNISVENTQLNQKKKIKLFCFVGLDASGIANQVGQY